MEANAGTDSGVMTMKRMMMLILVFAVVIPADANWNRASLQRRAEMMADRYRVPSEALKAICERESGWNPKAVGSAGEIGLCQLRPQTVALMRGPGWRRDLSDEQRIALIQQELYNPDTNLEWAARYLRWMIREAKGDITLAIAAYNAGPGVIRYVNRVKDSMQGYGEAAFLPVADRTIAKK
jgi:soluble lytic murein transglycosylase-like protein